VIQVWDGTMTAYLNGVAVASGVEMITGAVGPPGRMIGVSAQKAMSSSTPTVLTTFRHLRMRRLTSPPEPPAAAGG
jgi:hypothetical protein